MKTVTYFILFFCCLFLVNATVQAQENNLWSTLGSAKWVNKLNEEDGVYYYYPRFGYDLRVLEGKEVEIEGYYLPYEVAPGSIIVSQLPMASCFFCGNGGPESVVQVNLKGKYRFKTDQIIRVKGLLKLNADDIDQLNFIIDKAVLIESFH